MLDQIVRDHVETFRDQAARVWEGERLLRFIDEEFDGRLVPFFCKGRASVQDRIAFGSRAGAEVRRWRSSPSANPSRRLQVRPAPSRTLDRMRRTGR